MHPNFEIKKFFFAARAPFLTAVIVPALLGSAYAWYLGYTFNWLIFFLVMLAVIFVHLGSNMINDYFDHESNNDEFNKNHTPFSGGSRVIQDKIMRPREVFLSSLVLSALGTGTGIMISFILQSQLIFYMIIIGLFIGIFYSAPPFKLSYRTMGEIFIGLSFGILTVLFSFASQAQEITLRAFLISLPISFLVINIILLNEFPDKEADRKSRKKTLVVLLGKKKSIPVYIFLVVSTYLAVIIFIVLRILPMLSLIVLLTLPVSWKAVKIIKKEYDTRKLVKANASTIQLHLVFGILLVISLIIDKLLI